MDGGDSSWPESGMHVVIFPWLAFGHLLPGLELAQRLASRGHRVTFVSTPRNVARLPPLAPALASLIGFVALPLPRVDGLPDGAESTHDVPFDKFEVHRKAFDGLAAPFSQFLDAACAEGGEKPDCVIVDTFQYWAAAAAADHKVPCAMFLPCPVNVFAKLAGQRQSERTATEPHAGHEQQEATAEGRPAAAPRFETERAELMYNSTEGASGISISQRFFLTLQSSNLVAMRTCLELEPDDLPLLPTLYGKPVVPFGLLPPSPDGGRAAGKDGNDATISWLDTQPAESVVYVALGSEVPLSVELVHELALGLELAGTRFLWALRKPSGVLEVDILPPGFEERVRGRGLVTMGWVPQISVLAHGAVGAFLTHCGWNSIVEGLRFGHPLIMLPILVDQGPNARMMEGRKVGVQVPRDENDGSFGREGVATAVRAVAVEEGGRRVFAANAKKLQEIVADSECHERCIDGFVEHLRSYNK